MTLKNKKLLSFIVIFLTAFTCFFSYNTKATVRRCALCQCQYYRVQPYEVLKVYTDEKNLCAIEICEQCAHADDEKENGSTYSETSDENQHDSTHDAMEVACDTHNTDHLHKKKILIIKTQIECILEKIGNCDNVASHFKDAPDGIACRGLTVQLITSVSFHFFRLTFCNSFYNQSTGPDVIEAIATRPCIQHLMFHSADNIAIYNNSTIPYFKDGMKTCSESEIIHHMHNNIDKNVTEAIKKTELSTWSLILPSDQHSLLDIPLATFLAIRNALEEIVHTPYLSYQLLPYDQQKYIDHVTQHCTEYVEAWLHDLPSYQEKVTGLPDSRTLSESLASNLERHSTKNSFQISIIDSKPLCALSAQSFKKILIHDIVFYGNTLLIYQKHEQNIDYNGKKTTPWTLYVAKLPKLNANADCDSNLSEIEVANSIKNITNFIQSKNCCSMSNDGTFFLHQDLMSRLYYLSVRDGQQYRQSSVQVLDQHDLCLAMSNECDQSFYICVQRHLPHICIQDTGQEALYPHYQIRILQMKFSDKSMTQQASFSYIEKTSHLKVSFNAYFSSTGNLLFLQNIVPASLSDTYNHLIRVYEKQDNHWKVIVDNMPYQPYAQELLKPDDWDNASIVDLSGHCFLINQKLKQPFSDGVINGLTLYKKTNNTWETYSLPYSNHSEFRTAQANIHRICFSPNGKKLTLLLYQQQPLLSAYTYNFCTWLIKKTNITFIINYVLSYSENTPCHFILNKKYPTIYNANNKNFLIYTAAAKRTSPIQITVIDNNYLESEPITTLHHTPPIAFSNDRKTSITCDNTAPEFITHESILTVHKKSKKTVELHTNYFDSLPIIFRIPNMAIHGMKMWTFDRYLVCWGLNTANQEPIVKILSLTSTINDSPAKEIVQQVTHSEKIKNTSAINMLL